MASEQFGGATEADLQAALRGDEAGFVVVYRSVHPGLLRYARVLAGDDAEDVCAETWLQVCRDLGSFTGNLDNFRGFVARVARNRAIDVARARGRRPTGLLPVEEIDELHPTVAASSEESALTSLATEEAMRLIADLPRDQAEAIVLRVVLGLDAKTAAGVLGKRAGAVRTASYRGLRTLQERLRAEDSGPNKTIPQ